MPFSLPLFSRLPSRHQPLLIRSSPHPLRTYRYSLSFILILFCTYSCLYSNIQTPSYSSRSPTRVDQNLFIVICFLFFFSISLWFIGYLTGTVLIHTPPVFIFPTASLSQSCPCWCRPADTKRSPHIYRIWQSEEDRWKAKFCPCRGQLCKGGKNPSPPPSSRSLTPHILVSKVKYLPTKVSLFTSSALQTGSLTYFLGTSF